ncbi:hypothetical protein FKM82_023680 [Ascaphus truei]
MDTDQLREYITSFSLDKCALGSQGYNRVLLQLFGYLGHGKSSFINSCKYVLNEGEFKRYSDTGHSDGGKTTRRIAYPLTDTITVVDNRGCATMNGYETGEIFAQLGNLLPLDQEVVWEKGFQSIMHRLVEGDIDANYSDFVVPIFVYSVRKGITKEEVPEIKDLLDNARKLTGNNGIILLTQPHIQSVIQNMHLPSSHLLSWETLTRRLMEMSSDTSMSGDICKQTFAHVHIRRTYLL